MSQTAIFWPMIAQVALVYAIYAMISQRRIAAMKAGTAKPKQFRENRIGEEPAESLFVRNNLANQFELPVLFFACCLALNATGAVTVFTLAMAWVFVAARIAHAWVHVTTNNLRHRRPLFVVGWLSLGVMWVALAWALAVG